MLEKLKEEEEKLRKAENTISVMTMLKEGAVPDSLPSGCKFVVCFSLSMHAITPVLLSAMSVSNEHLEELEDRIQRLEEERDDLEVQMEKLSKEWEIKVEKLTNENEILSERNMGLEEKVSDMESQIEDLNSELNEAKDSLPLVSSPTLAVEGEDITVSSL